MKAQIIIGTRGSKLALWQADYIEKRLREEYPGLVVTQKRVTTKGDRILDVPTRAPCGNSENDEKRFDTRASPGSSRFVTAAIMRPSGTFAGMSFKLCTARSMLPDSISSSNSFVKSPLPPIFASGTSRIRSPFVEIRFCITWSPGYSSRSRCST